MGDWDDFFETPTSNCIAIVFEVLMKAYCL